MNEREEIIKKINELQEVISDSKNNATPEELAEYLMQVNKLQARLNIASRELSGEGKK